MCALDDRSVTEMLTYRLQSPLYLPPSTCLESFFPCIEKCFDFDINAFPPLSQYIPPLSCYLRIMKDDVSIMLKSACL